MPSYASNITILQMVYERLTFVTQSPSLDALIGNKIYEAMNTVEPCLKIAERDYIANAPSITAVAYDYSRVGEEDNYTIPMRMIIADIVSAILLGQESISSTFSATSAPIKKAKAGSVEVEFGGTSTSGSAITPLTLIDRFVKSAAAGMAHQFGCNLTYCDECFTAALMKSVYLPFKVVKDGC